MISLEMAHRLENKIRASLITIKTGINCKRNVQSLQEENYRTSDRNTEKVFINCCF